jgi:chromosome segregation ATPase
MQAELSQLASRSTELEAATKALSVRREALVAQCATVEARLAEAHAKLDEGKRQRTLLQRRVSSAEKEKDQHAAVVSQAALERVAVDNSTVTLLLKAASVRAAVIALGQEIYALRHPAEIAALARAVAAEASGAEDLDYSASEGASRRPHTAGQAELSPSLIPDPDSIEGILRDIAVASSVRSSRTGRSVGGARPGMPRFRAADEDAVAAGEDLHFAAFSASPDDGQQQPAWLGNSTRSELEIQRDAAAASLGYTKEALSRAAQQEQQWLADKVSVASSALDLKNQMDDAVSRIESLRDAYDNSSFALDDVRSAVADLDFEVDLTATAIASATEAAAATEKEAQVLDARRQDLAMKLDSTQQQRVTRIVDLQSSIRDKLSARRDAASRINNAQRQRLAVTQDVSALRQRVSVLQSTVASTSAAVEDLKQRRTTLTRQRDVLTAELRAATTREAAAKQRILPQQQRRGRLVAAASRQESTIDRLQADVARQTALVEAARADSARRTAERAAVAAALSTLQLRLGSAEEEFSQVQAASQQAALDMDQATARLRSLSGESQRLSGRVSDARTALVRSRQRMDRAAANLAALLQKQERYAAIKARLLLPSGATQSPAAAPLRNSSSASPVQSPAVNATAGGSRDGFTSQIMRELAALTSTVVGRRGSD